MWVFAMLFSSTCKVPPIPQAPNNFKVCTNTAVGRIRSISLPFPSLSYRIPEEHKNIPTKTSTPKQTKFENRHKRIFLNHLPPLLARVCFSLFVTHVHDTTNSSKEPTYFVVNSTATEKRHLHLPHTNTIFLFWGPR